jgi:hypothetical protein
LTISNSIDVKRFIFLPLLLIVVSTPAYSQEFSYLKRLLKPADIDSNYIASYYKHHLHITAVGIRNGAQLQINNRSTKERSIYEPNSVQRFGLGLDYNLLTFEYTRAIDAIEAVNPEKGVTKTTSFRAGITGRKLLLSTLYNTMNGLYLSNINQFDLRNVAPIDGYIKRGDIQIRSLYGSLYYFFNHKTYSTVASLWQIDRQKKSAGSFTTGIIAYNVLLTADSVLNYTPINNDYNGVKMHQNTVLGISAGYVRNMVWKKRFFFNAFIIPGINIQNGKEILNNDETIIYRNVRGAHSDVRLILGYNGERNYFGINSSTFLVVSNLNPDIEFDLSHTYLRFFYGHRIHLPLKFIK